LEAFCSGKPTLIPTNFWIDNKSILSATVEGDIDDYCNLAVLVFAKIVDHLAILSLSSKTDRSALTASMTVL
jgi:hypothetical protein